MTASPTEIHLKVTPRDRQIVALATTAIGLSLIDAAIPTPLPGIKPGLANIVIIMVLARYDWATAAWVSGLRVFAVSLLLGQFLTPGFFLSLAGTASTLMVLRGVCLLPKRLFGPVSWSILAAFAHIGGQLILARLWLIPHDGLYRLIPLFALSALVFGLVNGLVAAHFLQQNTEPKADNHEQ